MDNIARLVQQLESPKKDKRYEACEYLRVSPSLPSEALAALEAHMNDPDKDVAEAARAAIALHTSSDGPLLPEVSQDAGDDIGSRFTGAFVAALVFTQAMFIILFSQGGVDGIYVQVTWCIVAPTAAVTGWMAVAAAKQWGRRDAALTIVVSFFPFCWSP